MCCRCVEADYRQTRSIARPLCDRAAFLRQQSYLLWYPTMTAPVARTGRREHNDLLNYHNHDKEKRT